MAQLKEGSVIRKSTGDEIIATKEDVDAKIAEKVKTNVPSGAKFTDTVYSHPTTHPASMITDLPTSLPANGGNADTVDGKHYSDIVNYVDSGIDEVEGLIDSKVDKSQVLTDVPANAKFTDTTYPNATTSVRGVVQLSSSTSSTSASLAATSSAVKAAYDLAKGKANSSHTHTIANVTNLQTTLNDKASSIHIHSLDGMPLSSSSASGMGIASTMSTDEITPLGISNIETQESELLASILDMVIDQERRLSLLEEIIANERGDA